MVRRNGLSTLPNQGQLHASRLDDGNGGKNAKIARQEAQRLYKGLLNAHGQGPLPGASLHRGPCRAPYVETARLRGRGPTPGASCDETVVG